MAAWVESACVRYGKTLQLQYRTAVRRIFAQFNAGRNIAQGWVVSAEAGEDVAIKRPVALAMTAVANGLRPWDEYER